MKWPHWTIAVLLGGALAWGGESAGSSAPDEAQAREEADAAAQQLMTTLMAELTSALDQGGPPAAMKVCSQVAQKVTRDIGERDGLVVRRTALRVRNPANRPDAFERAWLERAQGDLAASRPPLRVYQIVDTGTGTRELRHLRPIIFPGGVCSQCHGRADEISEGVQALLKDLYPEDEAIGFAPGDLRGAISVRVPLGQRGGVK